MKVCIALIAGLPAILGAVQEGDEQRRVPKVVSVVPAKGATGVDPSIREIRVTFDMSMARDGYSFVGGGEHFPSVTGVARWIDARTWAVPVRLRPSWEYGFSINGRSFKNFRSIWLVPAEPERYHFTTGGLRSIVRSPKEQRRLNVESFDALTEAIRTKYAYRDVRGLDWEGLFAEHRRDVVGEASTEGWARRVAAMLATAGDVHLTLEFDGVRIPTLVRRVEPNFDRGRLAKTIPHLEWKGAHIATGTTADGIVYILIGTWSGDAAAEIRSVHDYLMRSVDAKGIIIDVRPNAGGSEMLARGVAGWFVDQPRVYAKHVLRRGPGPDDFTPIRERLVEPNERPRRYDGPVMVLAGRYCMSSCEAFLLMMKQADRATLVGEPSYGSSGNPRAAYLPNGVKVFIPSWKALRPDGSCFENQGIAPDVLVSSEGGDHPDVDDVLVKAIALIRDTNNKRNKRIDENDE